MEGNRGVPTHSEEILTLVSPTCGFPLGTGAISIISYTDHLFQETFIRFHPFPSFSEFRSASNCCSCLLAPVCLFVTQQRNLEMHSFDFDVSVFKRTPWYWLTLLLIVLLNIPFSHLLSIEFWVGKSWETRLTLEFFWNLIFIGLGTESCSSGSLDWYFKSLWKEYNFRQ